MIRKATHLDVPAICSLIQTYAFDQNGSGFLLPVSEEWVRDAVGEGRFFAAYGDEGLVGCASLIEYSGIVEVRSLAVGPRHQGNGLGTELIGACVGEAKKRGHRGVYAMAQNTRPFERAGFQSSATPPQKVDAYCVACPLYNNGCKEIAVRYAIPSVS